MTVNTAMNGNEYRAVFSNYSGSVTSAVATLTVTTTPVAPSITTQPSSQTVTAGQNVTFTSSASGSPTPTVQWQVSTDGGKTFTNISGATNTTLTLNNVTTSMSGNEYEAVFTNSAGNVTSAVATLTVNAAPPPSPSPSPTPLPPPSTSQPPAQPKSTSAAQALVALILDIDALLLQNDPSSLFVLDSLSEALLGRPLSPVSELFSAIEADFTALANFLLTI